MEGFERGPVASYNEASVAIAAGLQCRSALLIEQRDKREKHVERSKIN